MDINLTKDSSILLHALHSPFYWRILMKAILYSGFNNPYKKLGKQENSTLFMNRQFVERKNEGRNQTKLESESLRNLNKNAVQEFHLNTSTVMISMLPPCVNYVLKTLGHTVMYFTQLSLNVVKI